MKKIITIASLMMLIVITWAGILYIHPQLFTPGYVWPYPPTIKTSHIAYADIFTDAEIQTRLQALDDERLAFVNQGDIWLYEFVTLEEKRLTNVSLFNTYLEQHQKPIWSSDGREIWFIVGIDDRSSLSLASYVLEPISAVWDLPFVDTRGEKTGFLLGDEFYSWQNMYITDHLEHIKTYVDGKGEIRLGRTRITAMDTFGYGSNNALRLQYPEISNSGVGSAQLIYPSANPIAEIAGEDKVFMLLREKRFYRLEVYDPEQASAKELVSTGDVEHFLLSIDSNSLYYTSGNTLYAMDTQSETKREIYETFPHTTTGLAWINESDNLVGIKITTNDHEYFWEIIDISTGKRAFSSTKTKPLFYSLENLSCSPTGQLCAGDAAGEIFVIDMQRMKRFFLTEGTLPSWGTVTLRQSLSID